MPLCVPALATLRRQATGPRNGFLGIPSGYAPVFRIPKLRHRPKIRAGLAEYLYVQSSTRARGNPRRKANPMGKKVVKAIARLKQGNFVVPSPMEVKEAMTPAGSWTALTLANWGVEWPPQHGWRDELRRRWIHEHGYEPLDEGSLPCDDTAVMTLWRECGLPEYFLGNGGTNHRLLEFARRAKELP